ncbi:MAG: YeeE/YedE thiosulfate transporter family protein [Syntrophotaleaceae bacterium]
MQTSDKGIWNPYLAGALSGLVAVLSVAFTGKFFGASTSFVRTTGMIQEWFDPERVARMEYYIKEAPKVEWQWMFVVGILLGGLIAAVTSGSFRWQAVPDMWQARFGARSTFSRALTAFVGGVILMFGARMAGGCPSGHGLSGLMQLSASGFIALVCFFAGGVVVARLVYK